MAKLVKDSVVRYSFFVVFLQTAKPSGNFFTWLSHFVNTSVPSTKYNTIVAYFILFFLFSFVLLFLFIFINKSFKAIQEKRKQSIANKYREILTQFLFEENYYDMALKRLSKIYSRSKKDILIENFIEFHKNFHGNYQEELRKLFRDLGLHEVSYSRIKNGNWTEKIRGLHELCEMRITESYDRIRRLLHSRNEILRVEAQLAAIRLSPDKPFSFLDSIRRPFTLWEQINVYSFFKKNEILPPDFTLWLNSSNRSVLIFGLRMIQMYKATKNENAVRALVQHKDKEVRLEAIKTLGLLQMEAEIDNLIELYDGETFKGKTYILRALSHMPGDVLPALFFKALNEESFDLRLEACIAIKNFSKDGSGNLHDLYARISDPEIRRVIKHVADNRIVS